MLEINLRSTANCDYLKCFFYVKKNATKFLRHKTICRWKIFFVSFLIILIKIRWKVEFAVNEKNNTILYIIFVSLELSMDF